MRLTAIIADDEPLAIERIRGMLARETDLDIVAEATDGVMAVDMISKLRPNLAFLDVQMPGMDGFGILKAIEPEKLPAVVFVSAHDVHAVRAFEAGALDYICKPITQLRISEAVRRARNAVNLRVKTLDAGKDPTTEPQVKRFKVREGHRTLFIDVSAVNWLEAVGNYTALHTSSSKHVLRETLGGMERQISPLNFHRVSRSAIVNLCQVKEIRSSSSGNNIVLLHDGTRISITRSIREIEKKMRDS